MHKFTLLFTYMKFDFMRKKIMKCVISNFLNIVFILFLISRSAMAFSQILAHISFMISV